MLHILVFTFSAQLVIIWFVFAGVASSLNVYLVGDVSILSIVIASLRRSTWETGLFNIFK